MIKAGSIAVMKLPKGFCKMFAARGEQVRRDPLCRETFGIRKTRLFIMRKACAGRKLSL